MYTTLHMLLFKINTLSKKTEDYYLFMGLCVVCS